MKHLILSIFCILFAKALFADNSRYRTLFKSQNKKFALEFVNARWQLKNSAGQILKSIADSGFTKMTILLSDDGRKFVIIDDFKEGQDFSQPVLYFYFDGNFKRSYKLNEIVSSYCHVTNSSSHLLWALNDFSFTDNDSTFSLATFELNAFTFDSNGTIIRSGCPEGADSNSYIVFGEVHKLKRHNYELFFLRYIGGLTKPNNKIAFQSRRLKNNDRKVLLIRNGFDITPGRFRKQWFHFNFCLLDDKISS